MGVADFVTLAVHEHLPTFDRCRAICPRIDSQRAIIAVEIAGVSVAFLVAMVVALLFFTAHLHALFLLEGQVQLLQAETRVFVIDAAYGTAVTASGVWVMDVAVLAGPLARAVAKVIARFVDASRFRMFAWIAEALVHGIDFAVDARET